MLPKRSSIFEGVSRCNKAKEISPCPLQSLVRSIVEDKIVKQFVRFPVVQAPSSLQPVQRIGFMPGRIHHIGDGSKRIHFRLSVPAREQKDEYKKSVSNRFIL